MEETQQLVIPIADRVDNLFPSGTVVFRIDCMALLPVACESSVCKAAPVWLLANEGNKEKRKKDSHKAANKAVLHHTQVLQGILEPCSSLTLGMQEYGAPGAAHKVLGRSSIEYLTQ